MFKLANCKRLFVSDLEVDLEVKRFEETGSTGSAQPHQESGLAIFLSSLWRPGPLVNMKTAVLCGFIHKEYGSVSKPCTPGEHQNSW
jgi:hypothetical protein